MLFIPIVDAVVKAKRLGETARTRAVVIYPMNALANSQLEELKSFSSARTIPCPLLLLAIRDRKALKSGIG